MHTILKNSDPQILHIFRHCHLERRHVLGLIVVISAENDGQLSCMICPFRCGGGDVAEVARCRGNGMLLCLRRIGY